MQPSWLLTDTGVAMDQVEDPPALGSVVRTEAAENRTEPQLIPGVVAGTTEIGRR